MAQSFVPVVPVEPTYLLDVLGLAGTFLNIEPLPETAHLFVCTHGNRDTRCGVTGSAVLAKMRALLDERRSSNRYVALFASVFLI